MVTADETHAYLKRIYLVWADEGLGGSIFGTMDNEYLSFLPSLCRALPAGTSIRSKRCESFHPAPKKRFSFLALIS